MNNLEIPENLINFLLFYDLFDDFFIYVFHLFIAVLKIINIRFHPVARILFRNNFPAKSAHLRPARDAGVNKAADAVVAHDFDEHVVVLQHMGSRPDHAHISEEYVDELG